ncbi:hypothetical protein CBR_g34025 [Chara braunii]|uniref:Uncharacterized protein n=1 Tax=Chara braunii TaxID=69332 RepID=A0A388LHX4_CHABU|nr:hypothetical protein CBR_g34025 [Chara braunii]|eukprot:GBG81843.1 hypothetical protein CBR_g34025 [Chara braunii]
MEPHIEDDVEMEAAQPKATEPPLPMGGDVGMVGAEAEVLTPHPRMGGEEEAEAQNRSPPPSQTNYWAEEERVREMLSKCFDAGLLPSGWDIGEMKVEGTKAHFTLNPSRDEIKVKWLKERTVTVIFQEGSKNLPKKMKDDVIRAYENIWMGEARFDPTVTRGRVCIESSNVLSYVAKDRRVVEWMLEEKEVRVSLRGRWHRISFKPWMTKIEIQEAKWEAAIDYFWIRILDVPIDTYCYLEAAVEQSIGQMKVYASERDARTPQLINVRIDIDVAHLPRFKETISFALFQGQLMELKVANALTPWCSKCRRYFHLADDCTRQRRQRVPTPSRSDVPSEASSSHHLQNSQAGSSHNHVTKTLTGSQVKEDAVKLGDLFWIQGTLYEATVIQG